MRRSLVAVMSIALVLGACGGDEADPAATIESYIAAYNAGDIDMVMAHFTEESEIVDHPTGFGSVTSGLEWDLRRLHEQDLSFGNGYTISNIEVSGDTVTWDSVWGVEGCVEGHTTVVEDGKILTWTWGTFIDCP